MQISRILKTTWLSAALSCAGLMTASAQTANWIGASGGEWNTLANWDIGIPDAGTNAVIGSTFTVNYNLPMVSPGFGVLTNNGVLNINTNGFTDSGIYMLNPGGTGKLYVNSGGAVTVNGNLAFCSNSVVTLSPGGSINVNGSLLIGCGSSGGTGSGTVNSFGVFTNSGGNLNADVTSLNPGNGSITSGSLLVIKGGTNNLGTVSVKRSSAGSGGYTALGTEGLMIYGGVVTMTNLNVGGAAGNSFLSALVGGGVVTNFGSVSINQGTSARGSRLLQTNGLFVVPDPNVVNPNPTVSGSLNVYSVTGGTNIVGGFYFGNSNAAAGTVNFTNAATIYVGSQGISSNGAVVLNAALNSGGLFGATVPWTGSATMKLTSGTFTFQTADMNGNPNNITLTGALAGTGNLNVTGGGVLTLGGVNTYSGNTLINSGTLVVGTSGSLTSPGIIVGSGTTFDVSQTGGFTLSGNQTLSGFGTVTGAVTTAASSTIYPGSNTLTGTLTFNNVLTVNGNANIKLNLSGDPSGPGNDLINAPGGLVLNGTNTIIVSGTLTGGDVYPLISYGGSLTGGITNLTLSGATGTLSNSLTAQMIYLIVQTSVRGPTNITWLGNTTANNWDTEISTNWLNNGTGSLDFFVPGDFALFNNTGAINPQVNIAGSVNPGSVIVNTTSNYTFNGNGNIGGTGGLTVSNGTLNVLTTNTYTGQTIFAGGVLATPVLANSLSPSGIGAASSDPGNLIFNGGTFSYYGTSAGIDHGLTLTNGGGIIDVTNGTALTLNGAIVGNGTLSAVDSGTLILANANSYTNSTIIAGGNLQLNNANGAGTGSIVSSNGTLIFYPGGGLMVPNPFNFVAGTTNTIVVTSGSGGVNPTSLGNWSGGGTVMVSNTFSPFTVSGNMDAFTGTVLMTTPNGSQFRFYGDTGSTNATFDLGTNSAVLISRNAGTINLGALRGGVGTSVIGQGSDAGTVIWAIGYNNLSTAFYGAIANNAANQLSALTKVGTGTLTLSSDGITTNITSPDGFTFITNLVYISKLSYTGNTIISNGVLALVVPTVLTNTPSLTLAASTAVLDASAMGIVSNQYDSDGVTVTNQVLVTNGVFEVISGQALNGLGTIRGSLLADAGSTLNVGLPGGTGVLNVTNTISLNGATTMKISRIGSPASDELVAQQSAISFGGTLTVTNIGGQLQAGDTFTLFSAAGSVYSNSFSNIALPANATWDTSMLTVNGTIRVTTAAGPPVLSSANFSQLSSGSITLAATGNPGAAVSVLSSTNVALPLAQWSTVASGNFDSNGNYNPTISVNPAAPQQYFILQAQ